MKNKYVILKIFTLISLFLFMPVVNAQEKSKEEKERELKMQEAIMEHKKAMSELRKNEKEISEAIEKLQEEHKKDFEELMKDFNDKFSDPDQMKRFFRGSGEPDRNWQQVPGQPAPFSTPGFDYFNGFNFNAQRTSWEFSKSLNKNSFSRDYVLDVDPTVKNVVMAVFGDCSDGEINIKIVMPDGKVYADIIIDEFGNLNWRKSFNISETENQDKIGAWRYEIKSTEATGYFRISLQAN